MKTNSITTLKLLASALFAFSLLSATAQTTILNEGFEGSFPSDNGWSVGDSNGSGTSAYWDDKDSAFGGEGTHGGSWKGYCAGVGFAGTTTSPTYQNSMTAYMSKTINLAGYGSANLSCWYRIPSMEAGSFDKCRIYIDSDLIFERTVAVTAWTEKTQDLTPYVGGTHTLKFEFVSDSSGTAEGWYLDDIVVTGTVTLPPPTITAPGDTASPGPALATLTPTFTWNAVSGATGYGLYIRDLTTDTLIFNNDGGVKTGTSFPLPSGYLLNNGHAFRWAMTSFSGSSESGQSSYRYFQTSGPPPPTITAPGDTTSPGPALATLTPTFTWNAVSGATGYGLYIRDLTTDTLIFNNDGGVKTGTSFPLPSGYLVNNGHAFRWAMTSFSGSSESGQSSYRYFQTSDPPPPCPVQNVRISVKFVLDAAGNRSTTGAYNTDSEVQAAIAEANQALANNGANWRMDLVEILDVSGISQWFGPLNCHDTIAKSTMETAAEANPILYRWRTDAVNYYVISSMEGCGGICSFPPGDDIILINGQGLLNNGVGWLHELGHYFNLLHTFETFEPNPNPDVCTGAHGTCPDVCPDTFNVMSYHGNLSGANAVFSSCQLSIIASQMNPTTGSRRGVVYCVEPPPNDVCSGAIAMTGGTTYTINTFGATSTGDPTPGCQSTFGKGVWYTFTPSISGVVTVNTCASDFDTVVSAYTGACGSLTAVSGGCDNDNGPACASSRASVSFTGTAGTTYRILAGGFGGISGNLSIVATVVPPKQDQTITFAPLGNKTYGDPPFTVSATASSGLPVSFSIVSGPATISGNLVTITGADTVTVRASQAGDSNYNPAPDMDRSFNVAKANQTITFVSLANKSFGEPPFTVAATATSGLSVDFSIFSGPAIISGSTVTVLNTGTVVVRASQSGDGNYNAAPNVDQSFNVYTRPTITIIRSGTNVVITWPTNVDGYALEGTPSLAPPVSWTPVLPSPVIVNGQNTVTNSATGNQHYRLTK